MRKKRESIAAVAEFPERITVGHTVWVWDLRACAEDGCGDYGKIVCPYQYGATPNDPCTMSCRRNHPILRQMEIWAVCAYLDGSDITYVLNDYFSVRADRLCTIYGSEDEARSHKPGVVFH